MYVCLSVLECVEARGRHGCFIFNSAPPSFDKASPYTWNSPVKLDWLVSDPQDLLGLHVHTTVPGFCIWKSKLGSSYLFNKHFTHGAFYPDPICSFLEIQGNYEMLSPPGRTWPEALTRLSPLPCSHKGEETMRQLSHARPFHNGCWVSKTLLGGVAVLSCSMFLQITPTKLTGKLGFVAQTFNPST